MFGFWKSGTDGKQDNVDDAAAPNDAAATTQPSEAIVGEQKPADAAPVNDGSETANLGTAEGKVAFPRPSDSSVYVSEVQTVPQTVDITGAALLTPPEGEPVRRRRISFRSFGFFYGRSHPQPSTILIGDSEEASAGTKDAPSKAKLKSKREARRVEKSALVLRSFLLGNSPTIPPPNPSNAATAQGSGKGKDTTSAAPPKPPSPQKLSKASNQLLSPDQANQVIAKLRTLPVPDGPQLPGIEYAGEHVVSRSEGPIHAVCLDCTEEEADKYHFSRLVAGEEQPLPDEPGAQDGVTVLSDAPSIAHANLSSLIPVLRDIHIVTLVSSPDLGLGHPPSDPGPLAGAVPSAQVVNDGMMEITSQLLALGFATSKAVYPDHSGVYPPKDRLSVLTYWWGMEVCLPPPTLKYLASVKSIQNTALNLLTAISLYNNGVREILPFVRYISQYLDFQWNAIKAQNKGKGVVCAATWICPAALVPRPWDFVDPPPGQAVILPKALPPAPTNEPTLVFPGSKNNIFTPNAPSLPPVMITPATLPRGAKFEMLKT